MTTYSQHPLSAAFPAMSEDDFRALVADIRQHGQRDPASLYDGMVVDGWHRYMACEELGIPCRFEAFSGVDAVAFVRSKNQHRRHYQKSQQAAIEVSLTTWAEAHRPKKGEAASPFSTNKEMATRAGTTERTIQHAKRAHEAGLGDAVRDGKLSAERAAVIAKADPELAKQVAHGEISLPQAVKQITPPKPAPEPEPEDFGPDADELASLAALEAEDRALIDKLMAADDKLAAAVAECKRLAAELAVVKGQRDRFMNQANEFARQIKSLKREAKRAA